MLWTLSRRPFPSPDARPHPSAPRRLALTLISDLRPRTLVTVLGLACAFAALTGCGAHSITTGADPLNTGGVMSGKIYGGNSPIIGATVQLWAVGTTGYGSVGTLLATDTTKATGGTFQFIQQAGATYAPTTQTYACPSGTTQLYILAKGGNTGVTINNNAAGIAAIGPCSGASTLTIDINEVTTVATLAAMQQFFDPNNDSLGSPAASQAQLGLANAQTTINNLIVLSTGTARTSALAVAQGTPLSGNFNASITVSAGANGYAKINTIADIIAACINSNGVGSTPDNCTTLFTNAVPQNPLYTSLNAYNANPSFTFPTATDTVQAAYYILSNPTQSQDNGATGKLHNLFSLASAQPPFTGLSSQPIDWTIHIYYNSSATCTANSGKVFLNSTIHQLAADALGHIWIAGGSSSANSIAEIATNGSPLGCYGAGAIPTSIGITIDPNGSIYDATASTIYVLPNTGSATSPSYGTPFSWTVSNLAGITSDPSGNIFYTPSTATAIQEFPLSSVTSAPVSTTTSQSVGPSLPVAENYVYVATDSNGRIFAPDPNLTDASNGYIVDLYPTTATGNVNGYSLSNVSTSAVPQTNPYGVAVDGQNKVFSTTTCCTASTTNVFFSLAVSNDAAPSNSNVTVVTSPRFLGGTVKARGLAIDGAGNVWASMADAVTSAPVFAIGEVSNDLTTGISPNGTTPSTCTTSSSTTCLTGGGFQDANLPSNATTMAIDLSGNVWVPNGSGSSGLTEIVGQAVPVVGPIAAGPGKLPQ